MWKVYGLWWFWKISPPKKSVWVLIGPLWFKILNVIYILRLGGPSPTRLKSQGGGAVSPPTSYLSELIYPGRQFNFHLGLRLLLHLPWNYFRKLWEKLSIFFSFSYRALIDTTYTVFAWLCLEASEMLFINLRLCFSIFHAPSHFTVQTGDEGLTAPILEIQAKIQEKSILWWLETDNIAEGIPRHFRLQVAIYSTEKLNVSTLNYE